MVEDKETKPGVGEFGLDTNALQKWVADAQLIVIELQRSKIELKSRLEIEKQLRKEEGISLQEKITGLETEITELKGEVAKRIEGEALANAVMKELEDRIKQLEENAEKFATSFSSIQQITQEMLKKE